MSTVKTGTWSIGFLRSDDDFQIIATYNNQDGLAEQDALDTLVNAVKQAYPEYEILVLEREDAPYCVFVEDLVG